MSDGKKYYCFCSSNCKYETMTKEQILAAIAQAVETGKVHDVDTGFVTKVKEKNAGGYVTFWVGTTAQYNAIGAHEKDCVYIITDATTDEDITKAISEAVDAATQAAEIAASCVNPPMLNNTEYVTPERYDGKPVYAKRLCMQCLFTGNDDIENEIDTGIPYDGTKIVGLSVFMRIGGAVDTALPYITIGGKVLATAHIINARDTSGAYAFKNLVLKMNSFFNDVAFELDATIKYTKE
jgi:hypothetical protein